MAIIYPEVSRTFSEFLLLPNLTTRDCTPDKIDLTTPLVKFSKDENPPMKLNIPIVSAIMQSVSNDTLAIALARCGGLSFIYCSQPIESQAEMVRKVKKHKSGFVVSDSNVSPNQTLRDVLAIKEKTGHSTIAVTDDGTANGKLLGIITSRDYRLSRDPLDKKVADFMTPFKDLVVGRLGITLSEANDIIWENKLNCLPIVDDEQRLHYLVFRKDYDDHKANPEQLMDSKKRLMVGAGINTWDYKERVPELVKAEVDVLCVDSSDGFTEFQRDTIRYVKENFPEIKIGGGNVVDKEGFMFLVESGADFVKVGIGGGSICITREQKGIGRGQASAVIEVAKARDEYFEKTGIYIPICSDGGIVHDYHIVLALAMGADFVMMGRYFARFDESPTKKVKRGNNYVKEYWGEGSNRARNWQRYDLGGNSNLKFEEGVDSYVPYAGKLKDNLEVTLTKIRATMSSCGARNIKELYQKARLVVVSSTSIIEGGAHDVILKESDY
ncbi:inosine-5'-monophosphate dehydrogenase GuaB [Thermoclostridium stercorarium subsp. stercorarium DSM 8532]|jgi:IMP dehydrogenase|uniref:Inosine-5'-monophosphate dehydrogenase GuaB n=3 Tax=Thermoclostridium stercorarium TaxID=1510 RepID=L7VNY5_THES1|nr:IMP dehydrogenase [Thermoclostridium stercorarium]AGC68141.1 inosine-5'-monophosphate dehydrogenase GuaB [Thermoclostridium stercorarium subsp. stercorarium DSM 8532]AGI39167.1 IMP dehydrogenase [Thermoclostridium stercorarium subsp. stercorarium DSM 8532]ANW98517.1 inosine-5-monophosphate dehydrogenase [Thermoclostridium stercorarium subsp. thermolacticum DSM 2910]ANX01052.1 inosine-5-monophosphate dehydrogenase [Thermoclostridium stercorarium subsp. leptospartum DSM 9219]UZQ86669.1 IMP de